MRSIQYLILLLILTIQLQAQAPRLVVPIGHTSGVNAADISPDGRLILTGSRDGTAKLWNRSGQEIRTFKVGETEVTAVAVSPDGRFMVTGAQDQSVKLWDLSGQEILAFETSGSITSIAISSDGEWLAAGTVDTIAVVWNRRTGKIAQILTGHSKTVNSIAFSPDGRFILTGSWDGRSVPNPDAAFVMGAPETIEEGQGTAKLWDRATGREIRTFGPHNDLVTAVAFSPDDGGKQILTGSLDGTAKLWDMDSGKEIRTYEGTGDYITTVAFSPDGKRVLTGSQWGAVQIRDRNSGELIHDFQTDRGLSGARFFMPGSGEPAEGKYLLLAGGAPESLTWTV